MKFIVAAGGTGALCATSFIHLAAAGCLEPTETYQILIIDMDKKSDAVRKLGALVERYQSFRSAISGSENGGLSMPEIILSDWGFTEAVIQKYNKTNNENKQVENINVLTLRELYLGDNPDNQSLLDMLYTRDEQNEKLHKGFYGHPSIGSAVFKYVEEDFISDNPFVQALYKTAGERKTKLFVFGSVFGGTGASIFPNIIQSIQSPSSGLELNNLEIAGCLTLPYYSLPAERSDKAVRQQNENGGNGGKLNPRAELFLPQTREALRYYIDIGLPAKMSALYLVGSSRWCKTAERFARGADQRQHYHLVNLVAAYMACEFFELPHGAFADREEQHKKARYPVELWKYRCDEDTESQSLTFESSGLDAHPYGPKIKAMTYYAALLYNYMNYRLRSRTAESEFFSIEEVQAIRQSFAKSRNLDADAERVVRVAIQKTVEDIAVYCRDFLEFMYDISLSGCDWDTSGSGVDTAERYVDFMNTGELGSWIRSLSQWQGGRQQQYEEELKDMCLDNLFRFKTKDGAEQAPRAGFLGSQLNFTYDDIVFQMIKKKGFLGLTESIRTDVPFQAILQQIYEVCRVKGR